MSNSRFSLTNNKFSHAILICTTLALSQALIGCGNSDNKTKEKTTTETTTTSTTATSQQVENLDCTSPNVATAIQQSILDHLTKQAGGTATDLISQMKVEVTDGTADEDEKGQCEASIAITVPDSLINKAKQPQLAEMLASKGLTLENNTITAIDAGFILTPAGGTYKATPLDSSLTTNAILTEVGNLLPNAQATAGITNDALQPTQPPATNDTVVATAPSPVQKHAPTHHTAEASHTTTVTKKETKPTADDKTVVKTTTTKVVTTEKPATAKEATTKKDTTEATHTTKAVPNDDVKLTIEEKNEKY